MSPPARKRWHWLSLEVLYAIHDQQLAEHGGLQGVRDTNALESAMARPQHLALYGEPDAAALAAAYAHGLLRNHAFSDGNKRTAWVMARLFLARNGQRLRYDPLDAIHTMEAAAAGAIPEEKLAAWFRKRLTP